ncbi:hypothetical protein [Yinghuangia seranimata]|uniref:hypothetical protein n=1 Tax=Yinghuangia seranimata TaxID=408067 RepID=UPI00248BB291|nr:hypothetical protein [Yinghuangia seranimata]MDI2128889.1 hypothetical protein [Yinghuangia seranimata]
MNREAYADRVVWRCGSSREPVQQLFEALLLIAITVAPVAVALAGGAPELLPVSAFGAVACAVVFMTAVRQGRRRLAISPHGISLANRSAVEVAWADVAAVQLRLTPGHPSWNSVARLRVTSRSGTQAKVTLVRVEEGMLRVLALDLHAPLSARGIPLELGGSQAISDELRGTAAPSPFLPPPPPVAPPRPFGPPPGT